MHIFCLATKIDLFETEFVGGIGKNVLTLHISHSGRRSHAESAGEQGALGCLLFF